MRYGHLLAAIIFLLFLFFLGVFLLTRPATGNKLDVGASRHSAETAAQGTSTTGQLYSAPQAASGNTVVYTDSGFYPPVLNVAAGTYVSFENRSHFPFWPASDPHPAHTGYPVQGDCGGSLFDACAPIAPGQAWNIRFDRAGAWGYHDHLHPAHTGTIVVK